MIELEDEETPAPAADVDLSGIIAHLHDLALASARDFPEVVEQRLAAMRRVALNRDGSVGVEFERPIEIKGAGAVDGVRLRAIRARDYFDGLTERMADSNELADTVRFACHLTTKSHVQAIEQIDSLVDMLAVYFGVVALRKNFSRPTR